MTVTTKPSTGPGGGTAPVPVTALSATSTDTTVGLTWTNPTSPGLSGVTIRRAVGPVAPATPTAGTAAGDPGRSGPWR